MSNIKISEMLAVGFSMGKNGETETAGDTYFLFVTSQKKIAYEESIKHERVKNHIKTPQISYAKFCSEMGKKNHVVIYDKDKFSSLEKAMEFGEYLNIKVVEAYKGTKG